MTLREQRGPMLVIGTGELGAAVLRHMAPRAAAADIRLDILVRSGSGSGAGLGRGNGELVECDVAAASETELSACWADMVRW